MGILGLLKTQPDGHITWTEGPAVNDPSGNLYENLRMNLDQLDCIHIEYEKDGEWHEWDDSGLGRRTDRQMLDAVVKVCHERLVAQEHEFLGFIRKAYDHIDRYGVVYNAADPRTQIQQSLLDRLRSVLVKYEPAPLSYTGNFTQCVCGAKVTLYNDTQEGDTRKTLRNSCPDCHADIRIVGGDEE